MVYVISYEGDDACPIDSSLYEISETAGRQK